MRPLVVLLFDDEITFRVVGPTIRDLGVNVDPHFFSLPALKYRPDEEAQLLASILGELEPDAVIIGNNLGAGVPIAQSLDPRVLPVTMVAWNEYRPGDEAAYQGTGVIHFGSRLPFCAGDGLSIATFLKMIADRLPAGEQADPAH